MALAAILLLGYAAAVVSMLFLGWAVATPRFAAYRISDDPHRAIDDASLYRSVARNGLFSGMLIFVLAFSLQGFLFREGPLPPWRFLLEMVTVVVIYDFLYYFMHRYLLHEWSMFRSAHAVHHAAQNPRVIDSLLLHPLETFFGLTLLFVSILAVGGIHLYTFAPVFIAYTTLNVFNHAGVALPWFPFRTIGFLAIKHDIHHHSMLSGNYASITPLPDFVFGTLE